MRPKVTAAMAAASPEAAVAGAAVPAVTCVHRGRFLLAVASEKIDS